MAEKTKRMCINCKLWKPFKESEGMESYNFIDDFKVGTCKNKKSDKYGVYLRTAENFGCIHFQEIEP